MTHQHECQCSDHAAHLRDIAKHNEKQAPKWEKIGRHDYAQQLREGATICRQKAEAIENKRKSQAWHDMAIRFGEAM